MSKRKMHRRELPFISSLLDKIPFSKLPTNGVVLRRIMFELQEHNGSCNVSIASDTVMDELVKVWEYAGYGDILQDKSHISKKISTLHQSYKKLLKIPVSRRQTESFKKKEDEFTKSLKLLFDVTVKPLHESGLITAENRKFLLHQVTVLQRFKSRRNLHEKNPIKSFHLLAVCHSSPPPPIPLMMSLLLEPPSTHQKNTLLNAPALLKLLERLWRYQKTL